MEVVCGKMKKVTLISDNGCKVKQMALESSLKLLEADFKEALLILSKVGMELNYFKVGTCIKALMMKVNFMDLVNIIGKMEAIIKVNSKKE